MPRMYFFIITCRGKKTDSRDKYSFSIDGTIKASENETQSSIYERVLVILEEQTGVPKETMMVDFYYLAPDKI